MLHFNFILFRSCAAIWSVYAYFSRLISYSTVFTWATSHHFCLCRTFISLSSALCRYSVLIFVTGLIFACIHMRTSWHMLLMLQFSSAYRKTFTFLGFYCFSEIYIYFWLALYCWKYVFTFWLAFYCWNVEYFTPNVRSFVCELLLQLPMQITLIMQ